MICYDMRCKLEKKLPSLINHQLKTSIKQKDAHIYRNLKDK